MCHTFQDLVILILEPGVRLLLRSGLVCAHKSLDTTAN